MQPWSWPRSALHVRPSSLSLYGEGGGFVLSKPFKAMFVLGGVARAFSAYQGCGFRRWSQDFSELEGGW